MSDQATVTSAVDKESSLPKNEAVAANVASIVKSSTKS